MKRVFKNICEYEVTIKKVYHYGERTDCIVAFDDGTELCVDVVNANSKKVEKGDVVKMNILFTLDCIFLGAVDGLVTEEGLEPTYDGDGLRILYKCCFDKNEYYRAMPIAALSGKVIKANALESSFNTLFVYGGGIKHKISCGGKVFSVIRPIVTYDDQAPTGRYAMGDTLSGNYEAVARIIQKL